MTAPVLQMAESKENICPSKSRGQSKGFGAKKELLRDVHSHTQKDPHITHLPTAQDTAEGSPTYAQKSGPRRNKLDHYAIIQFLLTTKLAMKKTENNNALYSWQMSRPTSTKPNRL